MAGERRAFITGIGPVTPIGVGKDSFWAGLQEGKSAIARATRIDTQETRAKCSAEIRDFDPASIAPQIDSRLLARTDRHTRFALVASHLALEDAGLSLSADRPRERFGVSFGTALGGIADAESEHRLYLEEGPRATNSTLALQIFGGAAHSNLAIAFGLQGPANTVSNSCASGNVALFDALRWIREGSADVVIAGASEAPLAPLTFAAFDRIRTMSRWQVEPAEHACRPFDQNRDGFVMGEGAAALIIESEEHAEARGATTYAELAGGSLVNEAYHMTSPRPGGEPVKRAIELALEDAGVEPAEIEYLSPHGSSTQLNDINEAAVAAELFGADAALPTTALKAYLGHALGAASAMEAAATCLSMKKGWLPPCIHLENPEPNLPLDLMNESGGLNREPRAALSNAFGFGGANSCLVFRRAEGNYPSPS